MPWVLRGSNLPGLSLITALILLASVGLSRVAVAAEDLLSASGVSQLLASADRLVDDELRGAGGYAADASAIDMQRLTERLSAQGRTEVLRGAMVEALSLRLDQTSAADARQLLGRSEMTRLTRRLAEAAGDDQRTEFLAYRQQLRNGTPRDVRLDLARRLDNALRRSQFMTELQIQLRKSLLADVAVQSGEGRPDEAELTIQLAGYRATLVSDMEQESVDFLLYALRFDPSKDIEGMLAVVEAKPVARALTLMQQSLGDHFIQQRALLP